MLNVNEVTRLYLGVQGENLQQTITIDVRPWLVSHPGGSVSIWYKRNGDEVMGPTGAVFDDEAGTISWSPTNVETYVDGEGEAEIRLTVGNVVKKSRSIITAVSPAATGAGSQLDSSWQGYIDEVDRIKSLAVAAKQGAETAQGLAEAAEAAAEAAQEAAEAAQAGTEDAQEAAEAAQEAAETAQGKAEDAQQAAETAQGKAEDAQEAAETAQGKAEDAQEAAETAQGKAENAQEAAETAQGKAEDAQEAAETAQGKAEDAQDAAEDARDEAAEWATGGTTGTPSATNNAKYYSEQAAVSAVEQIELVEAAGAEQVAAVEAAGEEVLESIPEDYTNLSNTVDNLSSQASENEVAFGGGELTLIENKSIQIATYNRAVLPEKIEDHEGFCCLCIRCKPGDAFTVTGFAGNNTRRVWGFSNELGKLIVCSDNNIVVTEATVTAPDGSAYFSYNSSMSYAHKVIKEIVPIISRIVDEIPQKVDVSQGAEKAGKVLTVDSDGMVVPDVPVTNSILNRKKTNLIHEYLPYNLSTSGTISYDLNGNYWITNRIPVEQGKIYVISGTVYRSAAYDEEETFVKINPANSNSFYVPGETHAYVILCVSSANIGAVQFFEYQYANIDFTAPEYIDTGLNDNGAKKIQEVTELYAEADSLRFTNGRNLFNCILDKVYFGGTNGVIIDGVFTPNYAITKRVWDKTGEVESNGRAATDTYFPVKAGDVLVCNMRIFGGAYYNSEKEYLGVVPARNAYIGWVVPNDCAYVRLDFSTSRTASDDSITTIDDIKRILVYTVQGDTVLQPKKAFEMKYLLDGGSVSSNFYDKSTPSMNDSEFMSAMRGLVIREKNKADHVYRFANFNMWVMMTTTGWENTRRMLMDYGVDFCGLEEVTLMSGSNDATISEFMKSWQFADGYVPDRTATHICNKSLLSRFALISSEEIIFESAPSDQYNNRSCIRCKVLLPRQMDIVAPRKTLSMYVFHSPITTETIKNNIGDEILSIIAEDDSDFIVIMSDTNDFGTSLEGKVLWQKLINGGFKISIPVTTKTITQDNITPGSGQTIQEAWCGNCIDQIFVSSNIDVVNYGVVNTKDKYYVVGGNTSSATDNEYALSDHDFVYADLKFNYDTPRDNLPTS